jgi:hypothetical protein
MALELCRASPGERRRHLPGDELVPQPIGSITHAITINAPPDAVWPWLVQLGSGRAGWYAYDYIDNGGTPSACRIIPELQHVTVGDVMPWLPGAHDGFIVRDILPERALVLGVPLEAASEAAFPALRASWALVLEPLTRNRTRLITRSRMARNWLAPQEAGSAAHATPIFIERIYDLLAKMPWPLMRVVAGSGHYLMESRMLRGIKRRAERGRLTRQPPLRERVA